MKIIHHDEPRGANPSRNEAIQISTGSLVAFLDDDCEAIPGWLENLQQGFCSEQVAAVTGYVENRQLDNIWEKFFIGQHRVASKMVDGLRHARRLVAGNMMVRRQFLAAKLNEDRANAPRDMQTSARGDEEGLRIDILKAGGKIVYCPDAVVFHYHPHTANSFRRQAFKSGRSSARLAMKYRLSPRWELLFLLIAMVSLPMSFLWVPAAIISATCFTISACALLYNELTLKGKTIGQMFWTLPGLVIYSLLRSIGYALEWGQCFIGSASVDDRHREEMSTKSRLERR
ncbi:MAG: glycosyltransferase [Planctomycetaceae bacterium]|nr:glycosyltransferase [Planctomycetaceae bacterium]